MPDLQPFPDYCLLQVFNEFSVPPFLPMVLPQGGTVLLHISVLAKGSKGSC